MAANYFSILDKIMWVFTRRSHFYQAFDASAFVGSGWVFVGSEFDMG